MEENLNELYARLTLMKRETNEVVVESQKLEYAILSGGKCLILKLLTENHYNKEIFKATMRKAWQPELRTRFRERSAVLFLVEFNDRRDKDCVIREGPWFFDKLLVMVKEVDGSQLVQQIQLTEALFWIRIHDLPLMARNEYVGRLVGNKIGRVEEVDLDEGEMAWGEHMRVWVAVNVLEPLLRGIKVLEPLLRGIKILELLLRGTTISISVGKTCWVQFSYEKLPNFYYGCARLGHAEKECLSWKQSEGAIPPYGARLRASGFGVRCIGWKMKENIPVTHKPSLRLS